MHAPLYIHTHMLQTNICIDSNWNPYSGSHYVCQVSVCVVIHATMTQGCDRGRVGAAKSR